MQLKFTDCVGTVQPRVPLKRLRVLDIAGWQSRTSRALYTSNDSVLHAMRDSSVPELGGLPENRGHCRPGAC